MQEYGWNLVHTRLELRPKAGIWHIFEVFDISDLKLFGINVNQYILLNYKQMYLQITYIYQFQPTYFPKYVQELRNFVAN